MLVFLYKKMELQFDHVVSSLRKMDGNVNVVNH